jgi:hypothetical protein
MSLTEEQKQKLTAAFRKFEEQKAINEMAKNIQDFYEKQQAEGPREERSSEPGSFYFYDFS